MFRNLDKAPADPILGLTEAFKEDPNPEKINLGVGVYKDEAGNTPVFKAVREAEMRLAEAGGSKSYLPMTGLPEYGEAVRQLLLGADHGLHGQNRAVTAQCPGGTGALRVGADLLKKFNPDTTVWMSDPTWANHKGIFGAAGLKIDNYPYYNAESHGLDFDRMVEKLQNLPKGDVVLLHGCCHNPSGVDLDPGEWSTLADVLVEGGLIPFVDIAYQGFAEGIDQDAEGLRTLCRLCPEVLIASSYSKNFGLYCERTGALTVVAATPEERAIAESHLKLAIRTNYSNPPAHGARLVATILGDATLRKLWEEEVTGIRDRIKQMRKLLVEGLAAQGIQRDFSFMERQNGMFSFSGLTTEQVLRLREEYAIYIVNSGRINVAGITPSNADRLCQAIAKVL